MRCLWAGTEGSGCTGSIDSLCFPSMFLSAHHDLSTGAQQDAERKTSTGPLPLGSIQTGVGGRAAGETVITGERSRKTWNHSNSRSLLMNL